MILQNIFSRGLIGVALYTLASATSALTIGPSAATDVGDLDIFLFASTKNELPNSSPAAEEAWIESVLGFDVGYMAYGNNVPITATNEDSTVFAWELADASSGYFLIKNAAFWAVFQNISDLSYAVVDADSGLLPANMNFGNSTISHYGVVNGVDVDPDGRPTVPLPSPLLLIGKSKRFDGPAGLLFPIERAQEFWAWGCYNRFSSNGY